MHDGLKIYLCPIRFYKKALKPLRAKDFIVREHGSADSFVIACTNSITNGFIATMVKVWQLYEHQNSTNISVATLPIVLKNMEGISLGHQLPT